MKLNKEIIELFDLFSKSHKTLYIIGGAVRNYLLNKEIKDYDFTTDATPCEIIDILSGYKLDTYQKDIGSIKVHLKNTTYEITTMRKEEGVKNFRYPLKISFVDDLSKDVLRRDFTINQIAYNPSKGIVDILNGKDDIENKIIRFIGIPSVRIKEDPIRILRALRFSLALDFKLDGKAKDAIIKNASSVSSLNQIRFNELYELLDLPNALNFIKEHLNIYLDSFKEINKDNLIKLINSNLSERLTKYSMFLLFDKSFIREIMKVMALSKEDYHFISKLLDFSYLDTSLYQTKLLMIKYQNNLSDILEIAKIFDDNILELIKNMQIIKNNKMALCKKDLKITYQDLIDLNIESNKYSKVINYLLDEVLKNDEKNTHESLIELIKKYKD